MALRLSDTEIAAIERAYSVLLAPFAYENGEVWRSAAARAVQECVGGEGSSFNMFVSGEATTASSSPAIAEALKALSPPPEWLVQALAVRRRELGLVVADWGDLFDLRQLRRTDFYNDVVRPNGISAPMSIFAETTSGLMPAALAVYSSDERLAGRHARRRKQVMRLLAPACCIGLRTYLSFRENLAALNTLAEDATVGILMFDGKGHLTGENASFRRLMDAEPERDRVRADSAHIVRTVLAGPCSTAQHSLRRTRTELQTSTARYQLVVTLFANEVISTAARAIVLVEKIQPAMIDAHRLDQQYSLTQREIEVAQLLRKGLSTKQISELLGITLNTTRRHLEHIYLKLEVHSRASAAAKLAGN